MCSVRVWESYVEFLLHKVNGGEGRNIIRHARLCVQIHLENELQCVSHWAEFACFERFEASEVLQIYVSVFLSWARDVTDLSSFSQDRF